MNILGRITDWAGKVFGKAECEVGEPLYPISPYLSQVSPELWRGSWPTVRALAELQKQGVRTRVNLCAERREEGAFQIPIIDNMAPAPEQIEQFLKIVKASGPVYVHCEQGKGRTGCMVAAYRIKVLGWPNITALREAEAFGLAFPDQKDFIRELR